MSLRIVDPRRTHVLSALRSIRASAERRAGATAWAGISRRSLEVAVASRAPLAAFSQRLAAIAGRADPGHQEPPHALRGGAASDEAQYPSSRALASLCTLARGTVVAAYEQLAAEGYIQARTGSGHFVSGSLPDALLTTPSRLSDLPPRHALPRRQLTNAARRTRAFPATPRSPVRAFRTNQPALDMCPTALWAQVAGRRLRRATVDDLRVGDAAGYRPLRTAIAEYLTTSRGVVCVPEQVVVVSGVQEAIDLVVHVLVEPNDRVCMEDPGYTGAAHAFARAGARVIGLRVDADGAVVPSTRGPAPRLVYLTPGHQFPLGVTMTVARRLAWLDWAANVGATILEDDYDSEYRFSGAPVPALQGLDRSGVVLFAGSFSKALFPSLRVGYLVVPEDLVDVVSAVKSVASRSESVLQQAVLTDFLVDGHFARHVRRMRTVYAERLAVLLETARAVLADDIEWSAVDAGLQTTAWLKRELDAAMVAERAAQRGVEVMPLRRYARGPLRRDGLVLGFAAVDPPEIRRGVHLLRGVFQSFDRRADGRSTRGHDPTSTER